VVCEDEGSLRGARVGVVVIVVLSILSVPEVCL
jgi:hypothetical protein